jgi:hypothetical protein
MTVHLSGALPVGDTNGLGSISGKLCDDPESVHVAVVLLDCSKITTNTDNGDVVPTARIRAIEPIGITGDAEEMRRLLRRAYERRTGKVELPLDMEKELENLYPGDEDGETP